jgi:hypothetical protein
MYLTFEMIHSSKEIIGGTPPGWGHGEIIEINLFVGFKKVNNSW